MQTSDSQYRFQQQVGYKGYYCHLFLATTFDDTKPLELVINYQDSPMWEEACRKGAHIVFDHFSQQKKGRLEITIKSIDWRPVDTNDTIVLFTIIKALSEALLLDIPGLSFDKTDATFNIPT